MTLKKQEKNVSIIAFKFYFNRYYFNLDHEYGNIPFRTAKVEGNTIDDTKLWNTTHNKTRAYCEAWCNSCSECKSFSICNDSECRLKDALVERSDLTKDSSICTSYYRINKKYEPRRLKTVKNKGKVY